MNVQRELARAAIVAGLLAFSPGDGRAAAPPPAAAATDPATAARLDEVHARNVASIHSADLAARKATSPSLKQLAARSRADHARLESELKQIAAQRGIQLTPDATIMQHPRFKAGLDRLNTLSGPEFDRAYAEAAVADRTEQVDALKTLRDQTAGADATLKKWLDDAENVMEEHRNEARVALKDVSTQQRQGRTPAK
jgi:predicted outer membrane protein